MTTWIIQEQKENAVVKIVEYKISWRVPISITATEYVACSFYGNGHCPSCYIVMMETSFH